MVQIDKDLTSIRGIDRAITSRLSAASIQSVADLQQKTGLPEDRKKLSQAVRVNEKSIYIWAKQADLMRITTVDAVAADLLVKAGIRNVSDLARADTHILKKLVDTIFQNDNIAGRKSPSFHELERWKKEAAEKDSKMVNNADDTPLEFLFEARGERTTGFESSEIPFFEPQRVQTKEGSFFVNLSEMMIDVGRGVALAQHELDKSSIEIQSYIDAHQDLANYGLTATWYAMPETTLEMKVHYTMTNEKKEEGSVAKTPRKIMRVAPLNAKYQNYFSSTYNTQSELRFRIVPIPPPTRMEEPVIVPDVTGMSLEQAEDRIKQAGLQLGEVVLSEGSPKEPLSTQVISQIPQAKDEARINDKVKLMIVKK